MGRIPEQPTGGKASSTRMMSTSSSASDETTPLCPRGEKPALASASPVLRASLPGDAPARPPCGAPMAAATIGSTDAITSSTTSKAAQISFALFAGVVYIANSAGMIMFNKFLMHEERFPFSVCLVSLHMLSGFLFSLLLSFVYPSLYPTAGFVLRGKAGPPWRFSSSRAGLEGLEEDLERDAHPAGVRGGVGTGGAQQEQQETNRGKSCRWCPYSSSCSVSEQVKSLLPFLPIALCTSISLICGNEAYRYSSVSFLQMMKEAQVVLVYFVGLLVGLEKGFSLRNFTILIFVVGMASLAVYGEMHFMLLGFLLQTGAGMAEAVKITVANLVMTKGKYKLDPMSFVLFSTPITFACLIPWLFWFWDPRIPDRILAWWPYLALNSCIAFCLNLIIATTLKAVSAVGFSLVSILKDMAIVFFSAAVFHDVLTPIQVLGFLGSVWGIFTWSAMKLYPEEFDKGITSGFGEFWRALRGRKDPGGAH